MYIYTYNAFLSFSIPGASDFFVTAVTDTLRGTQLLARRPAHQILDLHGRLCSWYFICVTRSICVARNAQPVAFGVSFLHSQFTIDDLVL